MLNSTDFYNLGIRWYSVDVINGCHYICIDLKKKNTKINSIKFIEIMHLYPQVLY